MQRAVGNSLRIEHITGHEHGIDVFAACQSRQPLDCIKPGVGQNRSVLFGEAAILTIDLPVYGVQETGH